MPKEKKPVDMTTNEAMKHLFPPQVVKRLKQVAHGGEPKQKEPKVIWEDNSSVQDDSST